MMTGTEAKAGALDVLRGAYLREVEQLAEELRPRLESGELHGFRDEEDLSPGGATEKLEALCAQRFVLEPGRIGIEESSAFVRCIGAEPEGAAEFREACRQAYFVRLVSPSEDVVTADAQPVAGQAVEAIVADVLRVAEARGWYKPHDDCPVLPAWGQP